MCEEREYPPFYPVLMYISDQLSAIGKEMLRVNLPTFGK